jgi:hypothetical protein
MIAMTSRTGTKSTLKALRKAGWWLLVSCAGVWRTEDFVEWVAENGCYTDFTQQREFDAKRFAKFVRWIAIQPILPQWVALPDIVMGGEASLSRSVQWLRWLRRVPTLAATRFMLVVQNGMDMCPRMMARIRAIVGPRVGIFVGGDTDWKLGTMAFWSWLAHALGAVCHVGRVNSAKRIEAVGDAGADSFDGSSVARFPVTLVELDRARRDQVLRRSQIDMFRPLHALAPATALAA